MNHTKTIRLELELAGDGLRGSAVDGDGIPREFSGRLGLMRTIDELLANASANQDEEVTVNPLETPIRGADATALRRLIGGAVQAPGEDGYDAARACFNAHVDQRPALIAEPASAEEVAVVVGFAREAGLRVAPQRTGHNAAPLGSLEETLLLKTNRLDRVHVDAPARRARVGAGARWEDVVPAASEHGLAALHGSSPDVSIAGYTLGGGLGWYARKHGLACNRVREIELVTADGEIRRANAEREPELFWALRGGGGNFGVVTALEFDLIEVPELYAGALFFPLERSEEVLKTWLAWTATAPEEATSVGRLLRFPDMEIVPEPVRGQSFALVEAAFLGSEPEAADLLAPLRELGAAIDSFAPCPPVGLAELHMDPRDPAPSASHHSMYGALAEAAIDDLLAVAGPGAETSLLSYELRHCGGAVSRAAEGCGALATLPGEFISYALGFGGDPELTARSRVDLGRVEAALAPYESGRYFNFVEETAEAGSFFEPGTAERLRAARRAYDPERLCQANHEIGADA